MKNYFIIAALLLGTGVNTVCAQNDVSLTTKKANALDRKYLRPSLTKIYISDGTNTANRAISSLKGVTDEKFDYNNVKNDIFKIGSIPSDKKERKAAVTSFIENLLAQEKIPNQIMHCWFPTDNNGELSIEQLVERGKYAATDADVKKSEASKRNTMLNELGEQLIDRSYIIAYIVEERTSKDSKGNVTYNANVTPYVYKLDFNDQISRYYYMAKKEGLKIHGIKYYVVKKPLLRQKKNESVEQYRERLVERIMEEDSIFYTEIHRTPEQISECIEDTKYDIEVIKNTTRFTKNLCACSMYGTRCPYMDLCRGIKDAELLFDRKEDEDVTGEQESE